MDSSPIHILDLCDELLLTILKKLNNIDVLCSLIGVNETFDRLVRDLNLTQSLDLTTESSTQAHPSTIHATLNRFCFHIRPLIEHNIQCLTLDSCSIDSVLGMGNYPYLHKLNLVCLKWETAIRIFYGMILKLYICERIS